VEKSFKYIKNISNGEGTIHLYSQIGDSVDGQGNYIFGISGSSFAYEMAYLQECCTKINVRINSVGGSVLDGYSIVSAILNSKVECNTYIDGLAASIAGVIAMAGKKCYMADYGTLMLHNPSGGEDKKVLGIVKDTLVTILSNRTAKTAEEIDTMMSKETWLNATQAKEQGMIDEIISSGKKVRVTNSLNEMVVIYNKLLTNEKRMKDLFNKLNLNENASEQAAVSAVEAIQNSLNEATIERDALKLKLKAIEDKAAADIESAKVALKEKAEALVNKLEADKKITKEEKPNVLTNASRDEASFEFVKNTYEKISTDKKAVVIFDPKNVVTSTGVEDRTKWIYNDWEKKDPEGLKELFVNNKEAYDQLFTTYKK
jgi:ATP-dependent protease ClpP protease subunit